MGPAFYYISRCQNTQHEETHLNITEKAPNQSLQLENTRIIWKKLTQLEKNYENLRITPAILGNGTFILLYSKVLPPPPISPPSSATHLRPIQTATV